MKAIRIPGRSPDRFGMNKPHIILALAFPLLVGLALTASAETLLVKSDGSGDYPTIQEAIDAASNGDLIQLENGTYTGPGNRDLSFRGKALQVASASDDPMSCIIDCEGSEAEPHRGFLFESGERAGSVLRGICITGGYTSGAWPEDAGGGICCRNSTSPSIENCILYDNRSGNGAGICCDGGSSPALHSCVIKGNIAAFYGGGIYCYDGSSPAFQDCRISGNRAGYYGGGMRSANSSPEFAECTFNANMAVYGGAGLAFSGDTGSSIYRCTIAENLTDGDGGGIYCYHSSPQLEFTLIAENQSQGIFIYGSALPSLEACDIHGNEHGDWDGILADQLGSQGNICADPQFCLDQDEDCYFIQSDSPCANGPAPGEGIGAWAVGCQDFTAEEITWSELKGLH